MPIYPLSSSLTRLFFPSKNHHVLPKLLTCKIPRRICISPFYLQIQIFPRVNLSEQISKQWVKYLTTSTAMMLQAQQLLCRNAAANWEEMTMLFHALNWRSKMRPFLKHSILFTVLSSYIRLSQHSCPSMRCFFHASCLTSTLKSKWGAT